jgi:hypothetical protein
MNRKLVTLTALAALAGLTACDPQQVAQVAQRAGIELTTETPSAPQAHQQAGSVYADFQAPCGQFTVDLINGMDDSRASVLLTIDADGQQVEYEYVRAGTSKHVDIYFPHGSGDHTVTVSWPGGPDTFTVYTNGCGAP